MMIVFLDTIVNAVNIWICYKFYCCFLDEKKNFLSGTGIHWQ